MLVSIDLCVSTACEQIQAEQCNKERSLVALQG